MLITPKTPEVAVLSAPMLLRTDSKRVLGITFQDGEGNAIDIDESVDASGNASGELDVEVLSLEGTSIYEETYWPRPLPDTRRITKVGTGRYQFTYGTEDGETDDPGTFLICWHVRQNSTSEDIYQTQVCDIVSPRVMSLLPRFRLLLDKSVKIVDQSIYCNLGYSDAQLSIYLKAGLSRINSAQPYPAWSSLESFPVDTYFEILCRSALVFALISQTLFGIDTDIPSFSSQGEAMIINHAAPMKALIDSLSAELARDIREFKLHFVRSGSINSEFFIGYGFFMMLSTAPSGALFRNSIPSSSTY